MSLVLFYSAQANDLRSAILTSPLTFTHPAFKPPFVFPAQLRTVYDDIRTQCARNGSGFTFRQQDLDTVLYGYAKNRCAENDVRGHALSGLKTNQLSYGKLVVLLNKLQKHPNINQKQRLQRLYTLVSQTITTKSTENIIFTRPRPEVLHEVLH